MRGVSATRPRPDARATCGHCCRDSDHVVANVDQRGRVRWRLCERCRRSCRCLADAWVITGSKAKPKKPPCLKVCNECVRRDVEKVNGFLYDDTNLCPRCRVRSAAVRVVSKPKKKKTKPAPEVLAAGR